MEEINTQIKTTGSKPNFPLFIILNLYNLTSVLLSQSIYFPRWFLFTYNCSFSHEHDFG